MRKEAICLKVPKTQGEKAIVLSNKLSILDKELEIQRNKDFIYIPLNRKPTEKEAESIKETLPKHEISVKNFTGKKKKKATLEEILEDTLPPHLLASLPKSMDIVGKIAIIEIPPELEKYKKNIGKAILEVNKNVQTVLAKASAVSGTYRLRKLTLIAGEPKTETLHKEYGCKYYVDLAKVYFSPRLSYEHSRVASQVEERETIIDMFTGVGPFAILIAKTRKNVKVYAIDINPHAIEFLERNVRLNRVENKVLPILGDAKKVVEEQLHSIAERVIMNLPEKALEYVGAACKALKPTGGIIHFYSFINAAQPIEKVKRNFIDEVARSNRKVEKILFSKLVRATAPYEGQVVLDAKIR
jgi:tRNA (guanine37-N1)-methyltransferase